MPNAILSWGVDVIRLMQHMSPTCDGFFRDLSTLGSLDGTLLILALLYWCLGRSAAARLGLLYLGSSAVNAALKMGFHQPRPQDFDAGVRVLAAAEGHGLPSGHAQAAVILWGSIALRWRQPWVRIACGVMIVLICLSRIYLGVHFPTDVLGGAIVGVTLLCLAAKYQSRLPTLRSASMPLLLLVAGVMLALALSLRLPHEAIAAMGALAGLTCGYVIERRHRSPVKALSPWRNLCRGSVGAAGYLLLHLAGMYLFANLPSRLYVPCSYALLGLWVTWLAPWTFRRLGVTARDGECLPPDGVGSRMAG